MNENIILDTWTTIKISGPDKYQYLDGVIPNNLNDFTIIRSAFLSPKAKIECIFWMEFKEDSYFLYTPSNFRETLIERLLKYKLSMNVKLEDISQEIPGLVLIPDNKYLSGLGKYHFEFSDEKDGISYSDFKTILYSTGEAPPELYVGGNPFEYGLNDVIHLNKGCFLGQEPLSRMFNIGKPRYFLYNVEVTDEFTQLKLAGEKIGELINANDSYAIVTINAKISNFDNIEPKLFSVRKIGTYPEFKRL